MRFLVCLTLPVFFGIFLPACHRPPAYVQRTPHAPAARVFPDRQPPGTAGPEPARLPTVANEPLVASLDSRPTSAPTAATQINRRMKRMPSLLTVPVHAVAQQPGPKPKPKLRLGNRIREGLGVPLRKELNWWQRISWKLKASVFVILIAVVFAILRINILAIIFGILGAFLLITGLKKTMKVRRPWF